MRRKGVFSKRLVEKKKRARMRKKEERKNEREKEKVEVETRRSSLGNEKERNFM